MAILDARETIQTFYIRALYCFSLVFHISDILFDFFLRIRFIIIYINHDIIGSYCIPTQLGGSMTKCGCYVGTDNFFSALSTL